MDKQELYRYRLYATGLVSGAIWLLLVWQYFHDGIPAHHLFANPNLPEVSNAWGGLLLPLLTAFLLYRIQKKIQAAGEGPIQLTLFRHAVYSFGVAWLYAVVLALAFSFGYPSVSNFMFIAMLGMALIFPLYRAAFYLGLVLGLTNFFGAVLPTLVGGVVVLLSAAANLGLHPLILKLRGKLKF